MSPATDALAPVRAPSPSARLADLLDALARDATERGIARWRAEAVTVTGLLVAQGRLPRHLTVAADDPAVVVARTVAAAHRRLAASPHAVPTTTRVPA